MYSLEQLKTLLETSSDPEKLVEIEKTLPGFCSELKNLELSERLEFLLLLRQNEYFSSFFADNIEILLLDEDDDGCPFSSFPENRHFLDASTDGKALTLSLRNRKHLLTKL